jgi:hypothetical protein
MSFYLESCIWPDAISRWIRQRNSFNLFKSRKNCFGGPGNDYTSVRERKHEPYTESPNSPRQKKARQLKSKVKSMFIIFFHIESIVHKEFVLAGQTVISAYCCDVLRRLRQNVRKLCPEIWVQKNWLLLHDNAPSHIHFSPGNFSPSIT